MFCVNRFRTDFIITASCDGHVKFWKKKDEEGIEFVKHFRSHMGVCLTWKYHIQLYQFVHKMSKII